MSRNSDHYSDKESARRAEEAIRRSFAMPYKPHKKIRAKNAAGRAQSRRRAKSAPRAAG